VHLQQQLLGCSCLSKTIVVPNPNSVLSNTVHMRSRNIGVSAPPLLLLVALFFEGVTASRISRVKTSPIKASGKKAHASPGVAVSAEHFEEKFELPQSKYVGAASKATVLAHERVKSQDTQVIAERKKEQADHASTPIVHGTVEAPEWGKEEQTRAAAVHQGQAESDASVEGAAAQKKDSPAPGSSLAKASNSSKEASFVQGKTEMKDATLIRKHEANEQEMADSEGIPAGKHQKKGEALMQMLSHSHLAIGISIGILSLVCCCYCAVDACLKKHKPSKSAGSPKNFMDAVYGTPSSTSSSEQKYDSAKGPRKQHLHEGRVVYEWTQSQKDGEIYIRVPEGLSKNDLDICISPKHVSVGCKGKPPFMSEETYAEINEEGSAWRLRNHGELQIHLSKAVEAEWPWMLAPCS